MDTSEHHADRLFIRSEIPVKFKSKEMHKPGIEYVLAFCRFNKKYEERFHECTADLERAMLLEGDGDYPAFCRKTLGPFKQ